MATPINWHELAPPLIFMSAMFIMFYFIVIRPTKKRQQTHLSLVKTVEEGDEIITVGGFHGKVLKVRDDSVDLELAPNVRVKLDRRALRRRVGEKDD